MDFLNKFLQEPHGVTTQKTPFFIVTAVKTSNLTSYVLFAISVVCWLEFLAAEPEVPFSIPGATRFSERQWVWNGVHSAS
jgi:hypothetical protein